MDGSWWKTLLKWMIWGENPLFSETSIFFRSGFQKTYHLLETFQPRSAIRLHVRAAQISGTANSNGVRPQGTHGSTPIPRALGIGGFNLFFYFQIPPICWGKMMKHLTFPIFFQNGLGKQPPTSPKNWVSNYFDRNLPTVRSNLVTSHSISYWWSLPVG